MAITLADFTKIWASTSPLTPYSFGESNYKEGWNFIGSTPPSRQMWDSLQKQNDEKLKYIVDNFLPLDGSSKMTGAVSFDEQGEIGFRGTTHTNPSEVCKQLVATAGAVDSAWNDGNAKLCLHTYDNTGTNTAEDGGFALQTSDGTNAPYLEGKPNGSLKWNGSNIITSAVTGNVLRASGSFSTKQAVVEACRISTHEAGLWLIVGFADVSVGGTSVYNTYIATNDFTRATRSPLAGGGGVVNVAIVTLAENEVVKFNGYLPSDASGDFRGGLEMVRLA